jgi:hypothetical protein
MSTLSYELLLLSLLLITIVIALRQWKILSRADRWMSVLLILTFIQESVAGYLAIHKMNNFPTYHVYTPIELFLIINYFDQSIQIIKDRYVGVYLGLAAVVISIINTLFFQSFYSINSYYLLFEGIVVIGLCMLSFYKLLVREDVVPQKMVLFWISVCFLFYWCLSYTDLGMWVATIDRNNLFKKILAAALYYANILFYLGLATVFFRYKKLIPSGE